MPLPFPTMEKVEVADKERLARWHCFLTAPKTASERDIADRIADRLLNLGGITPGLSQKIGFTQIPLAPARMRRRIYDTLGVGGMRATVHSLPGGPEPKPAVKARANTFKPSRLLKAS